MGNLKGLFAAPYTPLHQNGDIALDMIKPYVDWLVNNKIQGVFINGSTGDFTSLSSTERKLILEKWCEFKPKGFMVMAHVGHTNLNEARRLTAHAAELNVDAIATTAPYYFRPTDVESLLEFCKHTASAAAELPFYYYHIPGLTGSDFSMVRFLELASVNIPNFKGLKFSEPDLMGFKFCLEFQDGKYDVLFGVDEILICGLALGAKGAVGSTYNQIAPLYNKMIHCFQNNNIDEANKLQLKSMEFVQILLKYGLNSAGKAFMKFIGLDLGPSRLPHPNLSEEQLSNMRKELEDIGIFEYTQPADIQLDSELDQL